MAMPKKQMTSTRSGNRRSQIKQLRPTTALCTNCQTTIKPHTVCPKCGFYRGQKIK